MKSHRILIPLLVLLASCTTPKRPTVSSPDAQPVDVEQELGGVYETVVETMVRGYFRDAPDIGEKHIAGLRDYVFSVKPKAEFVREMKDAYVKFLETAQNGGHYPGEQSRVRAMEGAVSLSVSIARMITSSCIDVYTRRNIDPDFTATYFAKAKNFDEETFIAWISVEVGEQEFRAEAKSTFEIKEGDHFYRFASPPDSWANLCGRSGFLVIRDDAIAQVEVTMMN